MSEGPETRLTTEYLNSVLENKVITDWIFTSGQYENEYPKGYEEFYKSLPLLIEEVKCKGKLIYFICFNDYKRFYIFHSLRITGRWQETQDEYCKWYIEIENKKKLWFHDTKCLATLYFTINEDIFYSTLNKVGPDILTDEFTLDKWKKLIKEHSNKNITVFLTDQSIISGCGNYIKSEVLYYAKVSPHRKIESLSNYELEKIYEGLRIISRLSYNNKGMSLGEYTDNNGKKGFHEFHLKIYNKPNSTKIRSLDGRITFYDPNIQI